MLVIKSIQKTENKDKIASLCVRNKTVWLTFLKLHIWLKATHVHACGLSITLMESHKIHKEIPLYREK